MATTHIPKDLGKFGGASDHGFSKDSLTDIIRALATDLSTLQTKFNALVALVNANNAIFDAHTHNVAEVGNSSTPQSDAATGSNTAGTDVALTDSTHTVTPTFVID